jgi:hypothetical protein
MSERAKSVPAAYWELTKPRLSFLSVLTALAGYFCSAPKEQTDAKVLISLAIGTALAAGGYVGGLHVELPRQAHRWVETATQSAAFLTPLLRKLPHQLPCNLPPKESSR